MLKTLGSLRPKIIENGKTDCGIYITYNDVLDQF